jgi:hypothetical protein
LSAAQLASKFVARLADHLPNQQFDASVEVGNRNFFRNLHRDMHGLFRQILLQSVLIDLALPLLLFLLQPVFKNLKNENKYLLALSDGDNR